MNLKDWNYKVIYESDMANKNYEKINPLFRELYDSYIEKLEGKDYKNLKSENTSDQNLFAFVNKMAEYSDFNIKRTIVDYIAGQTDKFFLNECKENVGLKKIEKFYN